jgi:hypothetical protein
MEDEMADVRRASQLSFDDVTEAATSGLLRALEIHKREVGDAGYKFPPIIYGIWIMPDQFPQISNIPGGPNVGKTK